MEGLEAGRPGTLCVQAETRFRRVRPEGLEPLAF
jgi:hypothetical protein